MNRKVFVSALVIVSCFSVPCWLTSCGTVSGLGEDMGRLGRKIENKADSEGTFGGFGEDLQKLGRKMERKSDDVYYGDTY